MKKLILILIIIISFVLTSCSLMSGTKHLMNEKDRIVKEKYGELEYIIKGIIVYKSESQEFAAIEGVDYIIENSGNRGSVSPELKENYYLSMDIVKHEGKYKLLLYNVIMKMFASKEKMFVLTNYFLPIEIDEIINVLAYNGINQSISSLTVTLTKKGNVNHFDNDDINNGLQNAYFKKAEDGLFYMTLYDYSIGNIIIGTSYDYWIGNDIKKEIYYPKYNSYYNIVNNVYDTLNDDQIQFSLNAGLDFQMGSNNLEAVELWNELLNDEVYGKIFFLAFNYEEFITNIEEVRNSNISDEYYISKEHFEQKILSYDEDYFEKNILLFYLKMEGNISKNYIHSVTIKDNILTLNVNRFEGMETALSSWLEIVTIKKEDIQEITKVNLIVRTISPKVEYVYVYIDSNYAREFYINDNILNQFKDLGNISNIEMFNWSLNVDLMFGVELSDEDVLMIVNYLEGNPKVKSVGYKGKKFIRVQMNHELYDKVINQTITLNDLIDDKELINEYQFSINVLNFSPFVTVTFYLEDKGIERARALIRELLLKDYPFISRENISFDFNQ